MPPFVNQLHTICVQLQMNCGVTSNKQVLLSQQRGITFYIINAPTCNLSIISFTFFTTLYLETL